MLFLATNEGRPGKVRCVIVRAMRLEEARLLEDLAAAESPGFELCAELERELTRAWVAAPAAGLPPIAYALCWAIGDEMELVALATQASARRTGAARALLTEIVNTATATNISRITLSVRAGNSAAVRLYAGFGFRQFNVRRAYYRYRDLAEDALELELKLEPATKTRA
jgi:ribosomal protein S18 acetylase RimI-like enzyme